MNKRKRRDILFVCVVFVMALMGILGYHVFQIMHRQGQKVQAEVTKSKVNNCSDQEIIEVHSTFYNYRTDNEITSGKRNQGAQGLYVVEGVPFTKFNTELKAYYNQHSTIKSGIYTGNFYNYYEDLVKEAGNTAIAWHNYAKFYWAANIANRGTYSSVCQGIVNDSLKDFKWSTTDSAKQDICSGTLVAANSTVAMPYFDGDGFLEWNNSGAYARSVGAVKEDVGFPFRKAYSSTKGQYYEFDSTKDVVRFYGLSSDQSKADKDTDYFGEGKLSYYYQKNRVYIMGSDRTRSATSQFLPFNKGEYINISNSKDFKTNEGYMKKIDYGFGLRLDIPFRLSDNGRIDGKDMVFEFSGDDDVWVYVDGKLVMDLGGQHAEATGKINFAGSNSTAKATVNKVTYENGSTTATNTAKSNKIMENDTYSQKRDYTFNIEKGNDHEHVITVFYMERGMYDSNFKMSFNFVAKDDPEVSATAAPTATASSTTPQPATREDSLTIQNEVVTPNRLNTAFTTELWKTVEEDVFQYSVENKGTGAGSVGDSELKYPSGKLTVRQRDGCEKKYLSFGEKPTVRIFFEPELSNKVIDAIELDPNLGTQKGIDTAEMGRFSTTTAPTTYSMPNGCSWQKWLEGVFYCDVPINTTIHLQSELGTATGTEAQNKRTRINNITITGSHNGKVLVADNSSDKGNSKAVYKYNRQEPQLDYIFKDNTYDYTAETKVEYSQNLPYETPGVTSNYTPNDASTSSFQSVLYTTYQITEAYPAATASVNANILANDATGATRNTDTNGNVSIWSDDAATFFKQFAEGSTMRVRAQAELQKSTVTATVPPDDTTDISGNAAEQYISYATNRTESEKRLLSHYYNTSVEVASRETDTNGTVTQAAVKVSKAAGTFSYKKVNANSVGDVQITETFTHTVKTGDLYIYKELSGLMEDDGNTTRWQEKYEKNYEFTISFSNVFGGTSTTTPYSGKAVRYTRADKDGAYTADEEINITNGEVTLTGNQYIVISGIPVGTTYTITETNPNDSSVMGSVSIQYTADNEGDIFTSPVYSAAGDAGITAIDKTTRTITGVIPCEVIDADTENSAVDYTSVDVKITFTNQWGAITISKELAGEQSYANDRTYQFLIEVSQDSGSTYTAYAGNGVIRTEKKTTDKTTGEVMTNVTTDSYAVTDGVVELKAGQVFTLGELTLADNKKYRISEKILNNAIYECSQIKENGVKLETSSIQTSEDSNEKTIKYAVVTTNGVNTTYPKYDYIFINKFYEPYIVIEKYYDETYYADEEFYDGKTYADLTGAEQSFLFTVEEYTDAGCTSSSKVGEFSVVLTSSEATAGTFTENSKSYQYKISKKIKVNADHYYKVTEDTAWSWKYTLDKVVADGSFEATAGNTAEPKYAVIKGTRGDTTTVNSTDITRIPDTAKFYNTRKSKDDMTDDVMPEGDTHVAINKIEIDK